MWNPPKHSHWRLDDWEFFSEHNYALFLRIFVSGHETRSTAIPKLGKTWISVSGHETRSNRWIFPFPPFAEGVCCERPLDIIIIPTDGHTTARFFSGRNNICISFSSNWSNTFWTYKNVEPPQQSHWWPDDWAFFSERNYALFLQNCYLLIS